jgi:hypothetical protein
MSQKSRLAIPLLVLFGSPVLAQHECRQSNIGANPVQVATVQTGVRKGEVLFTVVDGQYRGDLHYDSASSTARFVPSLNRSSPDGSNFSSAKKLELLRPLLQCLFEDSGRREKYSFTFAGYNEMFSRLILAAAATPDWDRRRGRSRHGNISQFTVALLNEANTYPELASLFQQLGYHVTVSEAEKVLVLPSTSPEFVAAASSGQKSIPKGKYPCGASVFFTIEIQH